jgi:hypothetical protein
MLQIAVVSTELSHSSAQAATIAKGESHARQVLASNETVSTTSTL